MTEQYMRMAAAFGCWHADENAGAALRVAYTAMHGVGAYWTALAFEAFKLPPFVPVPEQV
jgi:hypothetical protein